MRKKLAKSHTVRKRQGQDLNPELQAEESLLSRTRLNLLPVSFSSNVMRFSKHFFCLYLSSGKFSLRHHQDSLLISVGSNKSPLLGAGGAPECKVPPTGP